MQRLLERVLSPSGTGRRGQFRASGASIVASPVCVTTGSKLSGAFAAKNKPSATCLWLQLLSDAQNSTGLGFPGGAVVKNPPANAGDTRDAGLIPGSRRSPGEGNGNPSRIPWTEEPGGYSPRGHKESDAIEQLSTHACHSLTHNVPLSVHPSSCSWMILRILQFSAQRSPPPLVYLCAEPCPRCHGCYENLL